MAVLARPGMQHSSHSWDPVAGAGTTTLHTALNTADPACCRSALHITPSYFKLLHYIAQSECGDERARQPGQLSLQVTSLQ